MTMPHERARALVGAHELLHLVLSDPTASVELKAHARWVARHYPTPQEITWEAKRQTLIDHGQPTVHGRWLEEFD